MRREPLGKVVVWEKPSGELMTTYFYSDISDEYINKTVAQLKREHPSTFGSLTPEVIDISDLPDANEKRKWRKGQNGKIKIDNSVKSDSEKSHEKKDSLKLKLKGIGLSDDEIKLLIR